jgi:hypothetical protein
MIASIVFGGLLTFWGLLGMLAGTILMAIVGASVMAAGIGLLFVAQRLSRRVPR